MYKPFNLGQSFRIVPPETEPVTDKTDVIMARGAFGSGEHETTASCIHIMESLDITGANFLDLGSGTGILGIAALKLGAARGLCLDIEADAVESAHFNCQLNGISNEIKHQCGTLNEVGEQDYGLILANIYGDILLDVCNKLVAKTKPGGTLLLSGILWEYNFAVRNEYESAGCTVVKNRMLEEFSTLLLIKG